MNPGFTLVCAGCLVTLLTARENVKSVSFDIWQHKYLLAFKPCENCYSLHDNMANTNSIVVAAIDSEYFAIVVVVVVINSPNIGTPRIEWNKVKC